MSKSRSTDSPVIVDYGAGNLRSVAKAFEKLGARPLVTSQPEQVEAADMLVLPGVGAAADTMSSLARLGLVDPIRRFVSSGRPFFGVCLGLQVLLDGSEEGGWQECLGVVPGVVRRFPKPAAEDSAPALKVPHMGWNQVWRVREHPLFEGIPDGADFYFVHSYYADPVDESWIGARTEYGRSFTSAILRDNLMGTQFHPEKSGRWGLRLLENFTRIVARSPLAIERARC